ncbi:hypothetical protein [Liquorilactobacillus capillatus]|uniref:N-acetyltransferase domain-containing protein n=1 Tax=Liquorilactobacillus capillatus DSM 19910 TaxID=1423731 RepID=A0A0R1M366_9LACO|nr:hypothetical protein [Liquorilactobacillus capillatus]KRL02398.1 hypothetical protein FC81_GL000742 [Liquorilactobacillus capillatus DSM 19910]
MSEYIVRQYKKDNLQIIADFLIENSAYQVNESELTSQNIELSFKVKEIERFYLLFHGNKLIGTTRMFNYIYSAKQFQNGIYSGFLLLDPTERNSSAIKVLVDATH